MTIDDKIRDEKLNMISTKITSLAPGKLMNMYILQATKYYLLIKEE